MKNKKLLAILLSCTIVLSLTGCGNIENLFFIKDVQEPVFAEIEINDLQPTLVNEPVVKYDSYKVNDIAVSEENISFFRDYSVNMLNKLSTKNG